MAGGPINGGALTGVIIPTVLQMASDTLNYLTNLTCLYDRYWSPDTNKATLPICMFQMKKMVSTYTTEAPKKRVILYEPQVDNMITLQKMNDTMRKGVMQTIVENAVKQPTTHTVEAIVPFQPIGRHINEGAKMISDMIMSMTEIFGGTDASYVWESAFSTTLSALKMANQVAAMASKLPSMDGVSYINMNSLEAMATSSRVLCMKMWTGYDYKYVMITGMTNEKQPAEDDVFRVNMTLQEIPVLAISKPANTDHAVTKNNFVVTAVTAAQSALVTPLIALTRVKQASGDEKTAGDIIKSAMGRG